MAVTATVRIDVQFSVGVWTAITADVVSALGIRCRRGMLGGGPLDRVAAPGTLEFTLRNDSRNSGTTAGWYSPNHASVRSGWTHGIPVRLVATYASTDYPLWRGRVRSIRPEPGQYLSRRVHVLAQDCIGDLADTRVRAITPQVDQTEDALLQAVIDAMDTEAQPPAVDFDAGLDTFPYAFDDTAGGDVALGLVSAVTVSALGMVFPLNDGTLRYQNRQTQATEASSSTFTDATLATREPIDVPSSLMNVYNRVRVTVHPRTIGGVATTVLYGLTGIVAVGPGDTVTLWGDYVDPANAETIIGGTDFQTVTATTDYMANSQEDGNGTNLTASVAVVATAYAAAVEFAVTNNSAQTAYLVNGSGDPLLQQRGRAIYDNAPITVEAFTTQPYGDRPLEVDLRYQDDANVAQSMADYLLAQYGDLANQVERLTINPQLSNTVMLAALQREIGEVVTLSETMTGLASVDARIQGVAVDIEVTKLGAHLWCTWVVAPTVTAQFWILDDADASLLDETTVLGYA